MASPELQQALFDIYLEEILIPALVELPEVDFKKTSLRVREGSARYLRHRRGASIKTIARHLGVSHRWVSGVTNGPPPDAPEEGWFMAIMDVMTDEFPDAVTALGVQVRLRRNNRQLSFQATQAHLDLYCDLGKLERVGEGYRALDLGRIMVDESGEERTAKLRRKVVGFRRICESYSRGDEGACFGLFRGEIDEELLRGAEQEMEQALGEIMAKYVAMSRAREASGVTKIVRFCGLLSMGQLIGVDPWEDASCASDTQTLNAHTTSSSGFSASSASPEVEGGD